MSRRLTLSVLAAGALLGLTGRAEALVFNFDYTYDTSGYFSDATPYNGTTLGAQRKALLNQAAATYTGLTDQLTAITSGGGNNFTAQIFNPSGDGNISIPNFSVATNTLTVFAGAENYTGNTLAVGGPGGFSAGGTQQFVDNAATRGQAGAPATDFGPFGGAISFDVDGNFFYGSTTSGLAGPQSDFLSVAIHELGHLMGIGTATSWSNKVSGNSFTGAASTAVYGSNPPVQPGGGHWAEGTQSTVNGLAQEVALDPTITQGTRKLFTRLDYAGLTDIGWQVPEPSGLALVGVVAVGALRRRRA